MKGVDHIETQPRPVWPAIRKGWRNKCPNCGSGPIMSRYLKVNDACPICSEELHHHRADDGPAYVTILISGHIIGVLIHIAFAYTDPDPLILGAVLITGFVASALYILPKIKGAFVNLQWAKRMHGFGKT